MCPQAQCIPNPSSSSSGVGKGALAGAVVGVLAFLFLIIGGFLWWRRRSAHRRALAASREKAIENIPGVGPSSTLPPHLTAMGAMGGINATSPTNPRFSRPMMSPPTEKTPGMENENPFDTASVRSGAPSAQSIPIALASDGQLSPSGTAFTGGVPQRPARSPDVNIRNTPLGGGVLSGGSGSNAGGLAPPRRNYAPSQRTDYTTSTMDSTASSAMEALYESPTIVTGVKRTVIGAGRSEVVPVASVGASPLTPRGTNTLTPSSSSRRSTTSTPGPSPLAQSGFRPTALSSAIEEEEDPFGDSMSLRSQSTNMTNMTFGMGTPSASVRSFAIAQPAVANRVNVASLTRSATLRSIGGTSTAPPSAAPHLAAHPHDAEDDTASVELYPPTRRPGSVQSFASNTDSVLASFPFVPPSPLPTSSSRSPLSVVFDPRDSHRQSGASSMFGSESTSVMFSDENAPPLPNTHDVAALNSTSARATIGSTHSPLASSSFTPPPISHQPTDSSTSSRFAAPRVSTSSSAGGLDGFDFEFSSAADEPMPPLPHGIGMGVGMARHDSAGGALSVVDKADFDRASSRAPSMLVAGTGDAGRSSTGASANASGSRASLDLLELSRDLAANRLAYDD